VALPLKRHVVFCQCPPVTIDLAANTDVICDWYNIPEDLSGKSGGTTTLPDAGAGVSVAEGNASIALYGFMFAALGMAAIAARKQAKR
jgi:hypothetical protein